MRTCDTLIVVGKNPENARQIADELGLRTNHQVGGKEGFNSFPWRDEVVKAVGEKLSEPLPSLAGVESGKHKNSVFYTSDVVGIDSDGNAIAKVDRFLSEDRLQLLRELPQSCSLVAINQLVSWLDSSHPVGELAQLLDRNRRKIWSTDPKTGELIAKWGIGTMIKGSFGERSVTLMVTASVNAKDDDLEQLTFVPGASGGLGSLEFAMARDAKFSVTIGNSTHEIPAEIARLIILKELTAPILQSLLFTTDPELSLPILLAHHGQYVH